MRQARSYLCNKMHNWRPFGSALPRGTFGPDRMEMGTVNWGSRPLSWWSGISCLNEHCQATAWPARNYAAIFSRFRQDRRTDVRRDVTGIRLGFVPQRWDPIANFPTTNGQKRMCILLTGVCWFGRGRHGFYGSRNNLVSKATGEMYMQLSVPTIEDCVDCHRRVWGELVTVVPHDTAATADVLVPRPSVLGPPLVALFGRMTTRGSELGRRRKMTTHLWC